MRTQTDDRFRFAVTGLMILAAGGTARATDSPSPTAEDTARPAVRRAAVEADWERQEQRSGSDTADPAAVWRLVRRGRLLVEDLRAHGVGAAAARAEAVLADVERRATDVLAVPRPTPQADAPRGFQLVAAAVGGGGPALDGQRVQGKDWAYSPDDLARFDHGLRTLAWDEQEVRYRFGGLRAGAGPSAALLLYQQHAAGAGRVGERP